MQRDLNNNIMNRINLLLGAELVKARIGFDNFIVFWYMDGTFRISAVKTYDLHSDMIDTRKKIIIDIFICFFFFDGRLFKDMAHKLALNFINL